MRQGPCRCLARGTPATVARASSSEPAPVPVKSARQAPPVSRAAWAQARAGVAAVPRTATTSAPARPGMVAARQTAKMSAMRVRAGLVAAPRTPTTAMAPALPAAETQPLDAVPAGEYLPVPLAEVPLRALLAVAARMTLVPAAAYRPATQPAPQASGPAAAPARRESESVAAPARRSGAPAHQCQ